MYIYHINIYLIDYIRSRCWYMSSWIRIVSAV